MKPGVKTSEFWLTFLVQFIPLLKLTGIISPDEGDTLLELGKTAIVNFFLFVPAAAGLVLYIYSRLQIKLKWKV